MCLHYLLIPIARHPVISAEGDTTISCWWFFWEQLLEIKQSHAMKKVIPSHWMCSIKDILSFEGKDLFIVGQKSPWRKSRRTSWKKSKLIIISDTWPNMVYPSSLKFDIPGAYQRHIIDTIQAPCCSCSRGGPAFSQTGLLSSLTSSPHAQSSATSPLLNVTCPGQMT